MMFLDLATAVPGIQTKAHLCPVQRFHTGYDPSSKVEAVTLSGHFSRHTFVTKNTLPTWITSWPHTILPDNDLPMEHNPGDSIARIGSGLHHSSKLTPGDLIAEEEL